MEAPLLIFLGCLFLWLGFVDHEDVFNGHLRTYLNTGVTLGTLVIIDFSQVVVHVDGVILTCLLTFLAGDAAHFTVLHGISGCIIGVAGNSYS